MNAQVPLLVTADRGIELVPSIDTDGMFAIAEAIHAKSAAIATAAGTGKNRKFRSFRTAEVAELTGLSDKQVRTWRQKNQHTLEACTAPGSNGDAGLTQWPLTLTEIHRMMDDLSIRPARPPGSRAIRLGVFNFKGGSTKSSTTLHLATYLAMQGWRTLVIDADPQGSLSTMFSLNPEDVETRYTLGPAFASVKDQSLFDTVTLQPLHTHIDGLDIVPANLEMMSGDIDMAQAFMQDHKKAGKFYQVVARAIETVEDNYDVVLIDGAPAFSFSALATMWAVDGMIVPVPPASPDFKATAAFCSMAAESMDSLLERDKNPHRRWAPFIFLHNRVKARQSSEVIMTLSREVFGRYRIDEIVADTSAVPNALTMLMSIFEATSAHVDARSLRNARQAYAAVGRRVEQSIRAAWEMGFAAKGETP